MNRVQRTEQGIAIANTLSKKSWEDIEYIQKEFQLDNTSEFNGGSKKACILDFLSIAKDKDFLDLSEYLNCSIISNPKNEQNPPNEKDKKFCIFLSHLSEYKLCASEIQTELKKFGISSFVAHEDIEPSKEWMKEIELKLKTCDSLVALLHKGFHKSKWTDQEVGYVFGRDKLVISVGFNNNDPHGFISQFQKISAKDKTANAIAEEIFIALLKNEKTAEKIGLFLVESLVSSSSFEKSNALAPYLLNINSIKPEWFEKLHNAFEKNGDLKCSYSDKYFNEFFKKHGRSDLCVKGQPY